MDFVVLVPIQAQYAQISYNYINLISLQQVKGI